VINGADKNALSSLLLRLSQLGRNFKSCLLSRRKNRSSGAKKRGFGSRRFWEKTVVSVLKTVTALDPLLHSLLDP